MPITPAICPCLHSSARQIAKPLVEMKNRTLYLILIIFFFLNQICFSQQSGLLRIYSVPERICVEGQVKEEIIRDTSNSFVIYVEIFEDSLLNDFLVASSIVNCYPVTKAFNDKTPRTIIDYQLISNVNPKWDISGTIIFYNKGLIKFKDIFSRNLELYNLIHQWLDNN